jgi:hypothetical protein
MVNVARNIVAHPKDQEVTVPISTVSIRRQIRHVRLHPGSAFRAIFPAIANHDVAVICEILFAAPGTLAIKRSQRQASA